jgi:hypothetical protein
MSAHNIEGSPDESRRPYSIDLALELEQQLGDELESSGSAHRAAQFDPHILANLVMQLRHSIAEITKERDDLSRMLSNAQSQNAELHDNLHYMTTKCSMMEMQLEEAKKKIADEEEVITMLRSRVEESRCVAFSISVPPIEPLTRACRRGLMRLQAETRRVSQGPMTLDSSRIGLAPFGPSSAKRASFTPLVARAQNSHTRSSSVSEQTLLSPTSLAFTLPEPSSATSNPRRFSGLLGPTSPQPEPLGPDPLAVTIASLRRELETVKHELQETKSELLESNEAHEASETCVKALRQFIGDNNVGVERSTSRGSASIKPSPMLAMTHGSEPGMTVRRQGSLSGWGFKLWKGDNVAVKPTSTAPSTPVLSPGSADTLGKKFGDFFGSRSSASSDSSAASLTTPRSRSGLRLNHLETMTNGSDTSSIGDSVAEPISPTISEAPGGTIMVRGSSTSSDVAVSSDGMKPTYAAAEGTIPG